ncbi:MAG TPA: wax ester/triacylglycerol synthase family O-acyltransferase [Solirubrobacteraceae bacterium]|jgi:WS/DGAT/MGAT family acyltransferase|nr:wax ester/triacylglycerol synthase family O-acyltransferase [Solirubrobacteraceae bacterium]
MANPNRLSALDASFLHREDAGPAHLHVASLAVFEGSPPTVEELIDHVVGRLHLVPRYRQRLAFVPLSQGRPTWADDPFFNASYHVRSTALPRPGGDEQLRRLAGRVLSQPLDRSRPLWEMWLIDRLSEDRFALIGKTHHTVVDGVFGVDIGTVLFDRDPRGARVSPPLTPWLPEPLPRAARLLADALVERATVPGEFMRGVRAGVRTPLRVAGQLGRPLTSLRPGADGAPNASPLAVEVGPHRRLCWVDAELETFKAIKDLLGGTLNDVVLSAVSLALGAWLRSQGHDTGALALPAMVPVAVGADPEAAALGHRVAPVSVLLPVYESEAERTHRAIVEAMDHANPGRPALGAQELTDLEDFAPPTILTQVARLQSRRRAGDLVITNVPGPQQPLYLMGRRMTRLYPVVPLPPRQALAVSVISYDGQLGFSLLGDFDALPTLDRLARELEQAIDALRLAAGVRRPRRRR